MLTLFQEFERNYMLRLPYAFQVPDPYTRASDLHQLVYGERLKTRESKFTCQISISGCEYCGKKLQEDELCTCDVKKLKCVYCEVVGHEVVVCPRLHSACPFCSVRVHIGGYDCPEEEDLPAYRDHFEQFADQGIRTRERHVTPEWGWVLFDRRWQSIKSRPFTYAQLLEKSAKDMICFVKFFNVKKYMKEEFLASTNAEIVPVTRGEYDKLKAAYESASKGKSKRTRSPSLTTPDPKSNPAKKQHRSKSAVAKVKTPHMDRPQPSKGSRKSKAPPTVPPPQPSTSTMPNQFSFPPPQVPQYFTQAMPQAQVKLHRVTFAQAAQPNVQAAQPNGNDTQPSGKPKKVRGGRRGLSPGAKYYKMGKK